MKFSFFFLLGICFCALSCNKNNSNSNEQGKTQLLASADWKYDSGGIGSSGGTILVDFTTIGVVPDCALDNTIRFNANGNGTVAENSNVCSGMSATSNFTWSLSSDETILNVSGGAVAGIGGSFKIKELSATKLTLLKDTSITGFSGTAIINLKH